MAQEFPLGDCIVQQRCIMEAESFAGKQVSHRRNAAGRVRRGRVTVIHRTIGIECVLILETRAIAVWNGFQTALDRSSASESNLARMVRIGSMHRRRTNQEYSQAQRRDADYRGRAGRESMAEEKRHVSQIADNLPEHLQYRFSGGRSKGKTDLRDTLGTSLLQADGLPIRMLKVLGIALIESFADRLHGDQATDVHLRLFFNFIDLRNLRFAQLDAFRLRLVV